MSSDDPEVETFYQNWNKVRGIGSQDLLLQSKIAGALGTLLVRKRLFHKLEQFISEIDTDTLCTFQKKNEQFLISVLELRMWQGHFSEVFSTMMGVEVADKTKTMWVNIWDQAHYREQEMTLSKSLTALMRFRIRKRNPPPPNICPGGIRKTSGLPFEAKKALAAWVETNGGNPYPTYTEKKLLSLETNLSVPQVRTWFANARRKIKQQDLKVLRKGSKMSSPDCPRVKGKRKLPIGIHKKESLKKRNLHSASSLEQKPSGIRRNDDQLEKKAPEVTDVSTIYINSGEHHRKHFPYHYQPPCSTMTKDMRFQEICDNHLAKKSSQYKATQENLLVKDSNGCKPQAPLQPLIQIGLLDSHTNDVNLVPTKGHQDNTFAWQSPEFSIVQSSPNVMNNEAFNGLGFKRTVPDFSVIGATVVSHDQNVPVLNAGYLRELDSHHHEYFNSNNVSFPVQSLHALSYFPFENHSYSIRNSGQNETSKWLLCQDPSYPTSPPQPSFYSQSASSQVSCTRMVSFPDQRWISQTNADQHVPSTPILYGQSNFSNSPVRNSGYFQNYSREEMHHASSGIEKFTDTKNTSMETTTRGHGSSENPYLICENNNTDEKDTLEAARMLIDLANSHVRSQI